MKVLWLSLILSGYGSLVLAYDLIIKKVVGLVKAELDMHGWNDDEMTRNIKTSIEATRDQIENLSNKEAMLKLIEIANKPPSSNGKTPDVYQNECALYLAKRVLNNILSRDDLDTEHPIGIVTAEGEALLENIKKKLGYKESDLTTKAFFEGLLTFEYKKEFWEPQNLSTDKLLKLEKCIYLRPLPKDCTSSTSGDEKCKAWIEESVLAVEDREWFSRRLYGLPSRDGIDDDDDDKKDKAPLIEDKRYEKNTGLKEYVEGFYLEMKTILTAAVRESIEKKPTPAAKKEWFCAIAKAIAKPRNICTIEIKEGMKPNELEHVKSYYKELVRYHLEREVFTNGCNSNGEVKISTKPSKEKEDMASIIFQKYVEFFPPGRNSLTDIQKFLDNDEASSWNPSVRFIEEKIIYQTRPKSTADIVRLYYINNPKSEEPDLGLNDARKNLFSSYDFLEFYKKNRENNRMIHGDALEAKFTQDTKCTPSLHRQKGLNKGFPIGKNPENEISALISGCVNCNTHKEIFNNCKTLNDFNRLRDTLKNILDQKDPLKGTVLQIYKTKIGERTKLTIGTIQFSDVLLEGKKKLMKDKTLTEFTSLLDDEIDFVVQLAKAEKFMANIRPKMEGFDILKKLVKKKIQEEIPDNLNPGELETEARSTYISVFEEEEGIKFNSNLVELILKNPNGKNHDDFIKLVKSQAVQAKLVNADSVIPTFEEEYGKEVAITLLDDAKYKKLVLKVMKSQWKSIGMDEADFDESWDTEKFMFEFKKKDYGKKSPEEAKKYCDSYKVLGPTSNINNYDEVVNVITKYIKDECPAELKDSCERNRHQPPDVLKKLIEGFKAIRDSAEYKVMKELLETLGSLAKCDNILVLEYNKIFVSTSEVSKITIPSCVKKLKQKYWDTKFLQDVEFKRFDFLLEKAVSAHNFSLGVKKISGADAEIFPLFSKPFSFLPIFKSLAMSSTVMTDATLKSRKDEHIKKIKEQTGINKAVLDRELPDTLTVEEFKNTYEILKELAILDIDFVFYDTKITDKGKKTEIPKLRTILFELKEDICLKRGLNAVDAQLANFSSSVIKEYVVGQHTEDITHAYEDCMIKTIKDYFDVNQNEKFIPTSENIFRRLLREKLVFLSGNGALMTDNTDILACFGILVKHAGEVANKFSWIPGFLSIYKSKQEKEQVDSNLDELALKSQREFLKKLTKEDVNVKIPGEKPLESKQYFELIISSIENVYLTKEDLASLSKALESLDPAVRVLFGPYFYRLFYSEGEEEDKSIEASKLLSTICGNITSLSSFDTVVLKALTDETLKKIPSIAFTGLLPSQISAIPAAAFKGITKEQLQAALNTACSGLTKEQIMAFPDVITSSKDGHPCNALKKQTSSIMYHMGPIIAYFTKCFPQFGEIEVVEK